MKSRFETAVAASLVVLVTGFSLHAVRTGIFAGQSIPIDSLYVNGTGGEEMGSDYSIALKEGSDFRIRWNMNTVSTREGYSIYCGLQKNGGGYALVEPQKDVTEALAVSTTYDFECRSCQTGLMSSCFAGSNSDYITTYQRSIRVLLNGQTGIVPPPLSGISVPSGSSVFVVRGTMDEQVSGESLVLKPGSQARFAWNVPTQLREPFYSVYCGMTKNGGPITQVPASNDSVEQITSQTAYEFACRSCPNWRDYDGYVDPIVPWNNCWNPSNVNNFTEIIRKRVVVSRMAYCGDSKITGAEQCDDGTNTTPGDGCSMQCTLEPGWTCTGEPSVCNKCGNAVREGRETCDDGNTEGRDGCDSFCFAEPGYTCTGTSCVSIACSDGIDNDGDGTIDAQSNGSVYTHYFGSEYEIRTLVNGISALITPDPLREKEFDCGLMSGLKWSDGEAIRQWARENGSYVDNAADIFCKKFQYDRAVDASCIQNVCVKPGEARIGRWNGQQMIREQCDPWLSEAYTHYQYFNTITCGIDPDCSDGADNDYDGKKDMADGGCTNRMDSSEQVADSGCSGSDDPTEGTCGDGKKEPAEQCDDGNAKSGDGCSAECRKEGLSQMSSIASTSQGAASSASSALSRSFAATGVFTSSSRWSSSLFGTAASVFTNTASSVGRGAGVAISSSRSSVQASRQNAASQYTSVQRSSGWQSPLQTEFHPAAVASSVPSRWLENLFPLSSAASAASSSAPRHAPASASAAARWNPFIPESGGIQRSSDGAPVFYLQFSSLSLQQDWQSSDASDTPEEGRLPEDPVRPAVSEAGQCVEDLCSFGRRCIEVVDDAPDCILAEYEQGIHEFDANYVFMIRANAEVMRTRCMVLNAIWGAEGYGCLETFVFPYVRQVSLPEPTAFLWTRWIGELLGF